MENGDRCISPADSVDYVEGLKKAGNMDLFIWTYHCIQGTFGCTLENQLSNMIYFHAVEKEYANMYCQGDRSSVRNVRHYQAGV